MISEKIELLGKNIYKDIPSELTLTAIPTVSELEYVSSEDFEKTMIEKIFPKAIEEKVNFNNLLEIDFQWICRCLRLINYGPYHTTNRIFCPECGVVDGEARVDLRSITCKPLPDDFKNDIVISKDEFIDYKGDVHLHLLTIAEAMNAYKDKLFMEEGQMKNEAYARICYMITSMGKDKSVTPVSAKVAIESEFSAADYKLLKDAVEHLTNYGLRAGGHTTCPRCHSHEATFIALVDDRFFRPTVGDLREGRNDRSARGVEDVPGAEGGSVSSNS